MEEFKKNQWVYLINANPIHSDKREVKPADHFMEIPQQVELLQRLLRENKTRFEVRGYDASDHTLIFWEDELDINWFYAERFTGNEFVYNVKQITADGNI